MTYSELLAELNDTGIPFKDTAWATAPKTGAYGVVSFIAEGDSMHASNVKRVRVSHCSVDLYVRGGNGADSQKLVEQVLHNNRLCWSLNDRLWEDTKDMLHFDWNVYVEDKSWL